MHKTAVLSHKTSVPSEYKITNARINVANAEAFFGCEDSPQIVIKFNPLSPQYFLSFTIAYIYIYIYIYIIQDYFYY